MQEYIFRSLSKNGAGLKLESTWGVGLDNQPCLLLVFTDNQVLLPAWISADSFIFYPRMSGIDLSNR